VIRINLLPQKKRRVDTGGGGELWVLAAMGALLVEIVILFVFHGMQETKLAEEEKKNQEVQAKIQTSKAAVANHANVTEELTRMRAREDAIAKLQSARTGPTAVLLELARLLTPGMGPTIDPEKLAQVRKDNPLALYNPSWDPRRLWIDTYTEETRLLRIKGTARDAEDVSELAKRMNLSDYFDKIRLLPAKQGEDSATGIEVVDFALEAEVKY
jgi:type IV pilus assembly protein PilN